MTNVTDRETDGQAANIHITIQRGKTERSLKSDTHSLISLSHVIKKNWI